MKTATAFAILAAAASVSATPLRRATLPLTQVNSVTNVKGLVEQGQAKISKVNGDMTTEANSGPATNQLVSYVAAISIGGTARSLIVDTGSSNTWCGARAACEKTATGQSTGGTVSVSYGSGSFSGTEYTDKVSYAGLTVQKQSIGSASTSKGFTGVDGIVGFGPVGLTRGTVSNAATVPTFLDNLYAQKSISTEVLGVYFAPLQGSATSGSNGELTLGGTDSSKYSGSIAYYPTLKSGAASNYWGIAISNFKYGSTTLASNAEGIVDTGTTLIYIPTAAYNAFLSATGGTTDTTSGLASFTTKPTQNFAITFGSTAYTLTPDQFLVPQAEYAAFGLQSGKYYAWINNGGTGAVNTIIGQKFLEQYYSVYDTTNARIGFARRT